jgi:DNA-binding transcriptional ArsR family regulator
VTATDPERGVGLLQGLGLHRGAVELPEAPGEGNARLRPAGLHQPQSFRETSNKAGRIGFECREQPASAAGGKASLDAPTTELVQRADTFGEVDRIVQGANQDGASQPQLLCASRGEGHEFERSQSRSRAKHGFLCPGTVKASADDTVSIECVGESVKRCERTPVTQALDFVIHIDYSHFKVFECSRAIQMGKEAEENKHRILPEDMFMIEDLETLKVAADPLRLQILNFLRGVPRTVKEMAKQLSLPQTKLYYHMSLLEEHGLIRVTGTRLVSGIVEKQYQATAYKLTVDRALFWMTPAQTEDYQGLEVFLSAVLDYTHSDIMRSVRAGLVIPTSGAPPEQALDVGRCWFRLTPEQVQSFQQRLEDLCMEYGAVSQNAPAAGTQFYEFLQALYPTLEHSPPVGEGHMERGPWPAPPPKTDNE